MTGTVVFTLGNHDVELAMPACQAMLRRRIGGSVVLAFDGAGYRCNVGSTTALFLHGNNEDEWNTIDFDRLGRIAAAVNAGCPGERWEPNEGTRLVIDVLNQQKALHPFVEYVKPEKFWLLELIAKLGFGGLGRQLLELGPRQAAASGSYREFRRSPQAAYLGARALRSMNHATLFDADQLLLRADERHRRGDRILGSADIGSGTLGLKDAFRTKRADTPEIRAHILKSLASEKPFELDQTDPVYRSLGPRVGRDVHWVVCGHTHLRRSFQDRGDRVYFNSGTWMRLMDLYWPSKADPNLTQVLKALDASKPTQLDEIRWSDANGEHPVVMRQPTVVMLKATAIGGDGWLAEGAHAAAPATFDVPIQGSQRSVTP